MTHALSTVVSVLLAAAPISAGSTAAAGDLTLYGIENGFDMPVRNRVHVIDYTSGSVLASVRVTVPGRVVTRSTGMAVSPIDGAMYALVRTQEAGPDTTELIALDPLTGFGSVRGDLGDRFAGLAFRDDGTLYGVTGDGASVPETLYVIDPTDGSTSFLMTLGNGDNGEAIAIASNNPLFHASGKTDGSEFFESIDLATGVVSDIGDGSHTFEYVEVLALGYSGVLDTLFLSDSEFDLYTIDRATGDTTFVGEMSDKGGRLVAIKGLAFVGGLSDPCDSCPCPADVDRTGAVTFADLLALLGAWGECPKTPAGPAAAAGDPCDACACPEDIDRNGTVSFADILLLLAAWGPCEILCDDCGDGTIDACDAGGCHDCETPAGECLCVQGGMCNDLVACPDGNCPPGFFCCVNTCCATPVCLPLCGADVNGPAPDVDPEGRTSGGAVVDGH